MPPMNLVTMIVFNYLLIYTFRGWGLNIHMPIYIQSVQYLHEVSPIVHTAANGEVSLV